MNRYHTLLEIARETKPRTIVEVGTHAGLTGAAICRTALAAHDGPVHYTGYDVWEDGDAALNEAEMNGKPPATMAEAAQRFDLLKLANPGRFTYELIRGNTRETLHGKAVIADLAWIDGGHSVETINGDLDALWDSGVIACDDYYTPPRKGFGCNSLIADEWHITAPDSGVSIAVLGWRPHEQTEIDDPEWRDTVAGIMAENNARSVYHYKGDAIRVADCVVGLDCWDGRDLSDALWHVRGHCRRIAFLAFDLRKVTAAEVERALARSFIVLDRVETPEAFMVTARPVKEVPEVVTKGAGADEVRLSQARANIRTVKRRVAMPVGPHHRTAILVCYGPSLAKEWPILEQMAKSPMADVITVSAAHDFCIDRGVVPDYHVESDPRAHKAKHMRRAHRDVDYLFASCVHPAYVKKIQRGRGRLALWHSYEGDWSKVIAEEYEPGAPMVMGGANVGLRACMLFYALGYRRFDIFGMDCSFGPAGEQHAGKHAGKVQSEMTFTTNGRQFRSSMLNIGYARQFLDMTRFIQDVRWFIHGDGLLRNMLEAAIAEQKSKEAA